VAEGSDGLYLIDQHAAHERVLLERLERRFGTMDRSQLLMDPIAVELPGALRASIDDYVGALEELGFAAEPIGDDAVVIRAVSAALRTRDLDRVLRETHEALAEAGVGPDWRERLAVRARKGPAEVVAFGLTRFLGSRRFFLRRFGNTNGTERGQPCPRFLNFLAARGQGCPRSVPFVENVSVSPLAAV
jgi:hypothetical protein